jgi:hypothetical protein
MTEVIQSREESDIFTSLPIDTNFVTMAPSGEEVCGISAVLVDHFTQNTNSSVDLRALGTELFQRAPKAHELVELARRATSLNKSAFRGTDIQVVSIFPAGKRTKTPTHLWIQSGNIHDLEITPKAEKLPEPVEEPSIDTISNENWEKEWRQRQCERFIDEINIGNDEIVRKIVEGMFSIGKSTVSRQELREAVFLGNTDSYVETWLDNWTHRTGRVLADKPVSLSEIRFLDKSGRSPRGGRFYYFSHGGQRIVKVPHNSGKRVEEVAKSSNQVGTDQIEVIFNRQTHIYTEAEWRAIFSPPALTAQPEKVDDDDTLETIKKRRGKSNILQHIGPVITKGVQRLAQFNTTTFSIPSLAKAVNINDGKIEKAIENGHIQVVNGEIPYDQALRFYVIHKGHLDGSKRTLENLGLVIANRLTQS